MKTTYSKAIRSKARRTKKRPDKRVNTGNNVLKRQDYLNLLTTSKRDSKRRNALIDIGNKKEIEALCEIILNVMNRNIPLTPSQLKHLSKYKNVLRTLAKRSTTLKKKKTILKQKGGFLPAILPFIPKALALLKNLFF